jgi:hypothetical protein
MEVKVESPFVDKLQQVVKKEAFWVRCDEYGSEVRIKQGENNKKD